MRPLPDRIEGRLKHLFGEERVVAARRGWALLRPSPLVISLSVSMCQRNENLPVCPRCHHELVLEMIVPPGSDEPRQTYRCPNCGLKMEVLPKHHSPSRHGVPGYRPLHDLEEARNYDDAYAVFEGDFGGHIYLTSPVRSIRCDGGMLLSLLGFLDRIAWGDQPEGRAIFYERREKGQGIRGGMGGGRATDDVWLHPEFLSLGLFDDVRSVLAGTVDISELFPPSAEATVSWIRSGQSNKPRFAWAVVSTLMAAGFVVNWAGWKDRSPTQPRWTDVTAFLDEDANDILLGELAANDAMIGRRLEALASARDVKGLGGKRTTRCAVFAPCSSLEVTSGTRSNAEEVNVSIITSEPLERLAAAVVSHRLTAARLFASLSGGLQTFLDDAALS